MPHDIVNLVSYATVRVRTLTKLPFCRVMTRALLPLPSDQGCAKCTFMLDEKGQRLVVSTRRGKEVVSFSVADDKLLNAAIKTR